MYGSLKNLSPKQLARKVSRASRRRIRHRAERVRDRLGNTFGPGAIPGEIPRFLPDLTENVPSGQRCALAGVTANYVMGRFDLLGSGWLAWRYGAPPAGREGHRMDPGPSVVEDREGAWIAGLVSAKNLPAARNLWRMIEGPYTPIDWQLDARSGARWSAAVHTLDTPIGERRGADVKLPWELAKLQHLPRLALAHGLATSGESGFLVPSEYVRAYRNQVLDFLALNPPRYGANWASAMLSGIRIANLLLAHDLFRASGAEFDVGFERVLIQSTQQHIDHILGHLDWWDLDARNNHYLANVAGLAFAAAYLPRTDVSASILAFARNEIESELAHQFSADGSHFEGSSAYHAFSAEMAVWTRAILAAAGAPAEALKPGALPREARRRAFGQPRAAAGREPRQSSDVGTIERALTFLRDLKRPDGSLLQVGDNDSGRFMRLDVEATLTDLAVVRRRFLNLRELPQDRGPYWHEGAMSYASTISALEAGVGVPPTRESVGYAAIRHLAGASVASAEAFVPHRAVPGTGVATVHSELASRPAARSCSEVFRPVSNVDLTANLSKTLYPDFGLCLVRSDHLWLAIRCGQGHRADGGHSHADALSFELHMDGRTYRVDPGAYVYTSLPWRRQQFRSAASHGIPRIRGNGIFTNGENVFAPPSDSSSTLVAFDGDGLVGRRESEEGIVFRIIRIYPDRVEVTDLSSDGQPIHVEPLPWWSPGYGRLVAFESGAPLSGTVPVRSTRVDRPMTDPERTGSRAISARDARRG
jgi:heparinase II/III-like protein